MNKLKLELQKMLYFHAEYDLQQARMRLELANYGVEYRKVKLLQAKVEYEEVLKLNQLNLEIEKLKTACEYHNTDFSEWEIAEDEDELQEILWKIAEDERQEIFLEIDENEDTFSF